MSDRQRERVQLGDVEIAYVDEGEGPPVVLLHGFPDSADLWRHQIPALVGMGHRVVAPDLRGFGESTLPADPASACNLLLAAGDVTGLLDHLGIGEAAVVGHDFGAALAWALASFAGDRVERLVALSVGHPMSFAAAGIAQREKSWYMLLFQFEGIAEEWLSADDWANLQAWVTGDGAHPMPPDMDRWLADLSRPGALTAALGWYRANVPPTALVGPRLELPPVQCPTMGVWGDDEFALTEAQMTGSAAHVAGDWRYEVVRGAGHWLPVEVPDEVSRLLVDFCR